MIWHIVKLDFGGVDPGARADIERQLTGLVAIDEVAWLRVAVDVDDPNVTGLLTAFATREDLQTYRDHPDHQPVLEAIGAAGVRATRLDVETADDVADLP